MSEKRGIKDYAYLVLTGITMGSADVVPGVSGGTMAFIMGIYQELIEAIKSFNLELLRKALKFDIQGVMKHVPWQFLACIGGGIVLAIASLVHFISWALEHHEAYLYSVFFGLVVASILIVGRELKWTITAGLSLVIGTGIAWSIVGLVPAEMSHTPLILFGSGMVAITAMILPGISGSFILLILGQYAYIINAVKELDVVTVASVGAGCVVGIIGFSRVLSYLLAKHYQVTVAVLVGFMIGSLRKIWPFKNVLETMEDRHGELIPIRFENVWPDFSGSAWWICLLLAIVGAVVILVLHRIQLALSNSNS